MEKDEDAYGREKDGENTPCLFQQADEHE